ncbi:cell division protein ZapA [Coralloluteibacterium thermophilus]|uniref:Cell division protein ZapA n=1 Tax=Coralloluteibacterium thermophilum TaxID=2707049 RepID=A0ABV9NKA6_9GAMM
MSDPVNVRILDRDFLVACQPEERDGLLAAAQLLDARMREIRGSNRMVTIDRVAVLAALNLAHEFMQLKTASEARDREIARTVDEVERTLEQVLPGR